jgi:transcription initiation factor TFIID subunit 7
MSLKLKLGTKPSTSADSSLPTPSAPPKIKLKMSASTPSTPADEHPPDLGAPVRQKRKYTKKPKFDEDGNPIVAASKGSSKGKKRARDDDEDASPPAKRKPKGPALTIMPPSSQKIMPKLKLKTRTPASATPIFKLKYQGKPPVRPLGVGYDSECEDAEPDPTIHSQFVLRMAPGPDCDALRKAIEERKIGKPSSEGGFSVYFRYFDREARRSIVVVNGTRYAAAMVDLPCIVESMKSWNKRDWVKSADICQMLLVLGTCKTDEEAKNYALPPEVDPDTHQFAHGLTPPMHWVRKRRFRKRENFRKIEEVEAEVERLLERDRMAEESGGSTKEVLMDINDVDIDSPDAEYDDDDEEEDQYQDDHMDNNTVVPEDYQDGLDEMALEMERELAAGGGDDQDDLFNDEPTQAASSHDVAMHAIGNDSANVVPSTETPGSQSVAGTNSEDDDEDDEESEEEVDEVELAAQQELAQQREEIADLEKEIADAHAQYQATPNQLLRNRIMKKIQTLQNDLNLKKSSLGDEVD